MKTKLQIASILSLAIASTSAAKNFEGQIQYNVEAEGETMQMTYFVKEDKIAFEVPQAQGGYGILDFEEKVAYIIMPDQKKYMKVDSEDFGASMDQVPEGEFTVTDEVGEMLGHSVRKVIFEGEGERTEMWITQALGFMLPMQQILKEEYPEVMSEAFPDGFFPLDTIQTDASGQTTRMRVVSVDSKSLPDSRFNVPEGYRLFDMGGF